MEQVPKITVSSHVGKPQSATQIGKADKSEESSGFSEREKRRKGNVRRGQKFGPLLDRGLEWVGWAGRYLNCEESGQRSPHWEGHPFGKGLEGGGSFWKGLEEGENI